MSHIIAAYIPPTQPCRWCTHYGGPAWGESSCVWCLREAGRRCVAQPERGCAFYLRLTGVDDDFDDRPPETDWKPVRPPSPIRPIAPHRSSSARVPLAV